MSKANFNIGITFDSITSLENIRGAYFDLVRKFDEGSKSARYKGIDGQNVFNLDFASEEVFLDIQREMVSFTEIAPAYMATIPKKDGKKRKVYVYSIRERIKAEAIYRVLEPIFDSYLSDFLFSYRSSHPSYYAARSVVRRYKRHFGHNHVLVTDIRDYSDTIDHDILLKKLGALGIDANTLKLLQLFIQTKTIEAGKLITRPSGVLTGTPLYALLSNFYMDNFDKWAGKYVAFYRRVGDDMIAMDKDATKIRVVYERLNVTVKELKLRTNENKVSLIRDIEPFKFLGYQFKDGRVGFDNSSMQKACSKWIGDMRRHKGKSLDSKVRHLQRLNSRKTGSPNHEFSMLLEQKVLVDDTSHIQQFSDSLTGSLASYLFGYNTPNKRRVAQDILKKAKIRTLASHYSSLRSRKK